jgi:hypothetical protein
MGNCALTSPPAWCSGESRSGCTTNGRRGNRAARRKEKKAPTLPDDILLEIVDRADAVTLVRCAAASKYLRRHIADPAFLRHHRHADAGFVPSSLLGMFQRLGDHEPYRFVSMSPSTTKLTLQLTPPPTPADDLFGSCIPVTSRAGFVLLWHVDGRRLI